MTPKQRRNNVETSKQRNIETAKHRNGETSKRRNIETAKHLATLLENQGTGHSPPPALLD